MPKYQRIVLDLDISPVISGVESDGRIVGVLLEIVHHPVSVEFGSRRIVENRCDIWILAEILE